MFSSTYPHCKSICKAVAASLYMKDWSQEIFLSKTSQAWILLAAHHQHSNELIRDQKSSSSDRGDRQLPNKDFFQRWVAGLFKKRLDGEMSFNLLVNFNSSKDIGSGLKTFSADADTSLMLRKYMTPFTLHCSHMIAIPKL